MASARVLALFARLGGNDYIGEPVSIEAHCLQAAALAAATQPHDPELVLAALLHDVGHLLGQEAAASGVRVADDMVDEDGVNCGTARHEALGGAFVAALGLPARVAALVANHVAAKRYRVWKDPAYAAALTEASRVTLRHQGGPMSAAEAAAFEASADFDTFLLLRSFDERAKVPGAAVPPLASYAPLLDAHTAGPAVWALSELQLQHYRDTGYVRVPGLLEWALRSEQPGAVLARWTDDLDALGPPPPGAWLRHREATPAGPQLCRMENFLSQHAPFDALCRGPLLAAAAQLLGRPAALFKEKVNWKLPGGAGFEAHQDSPAYLSVAEQHVTAYLAVDAATPANGCLQMAPGAWARGQMPLLPNGVIEPAAVAAMAWEDLPAAAGDLVFFSGYVPHRSEANGTAAPRRAAFITYCEQLPDGRDPHAEYYAAKHARAHGFDASQTLSFQGDFKGVIVD